MLLLLFQLGDDTYCLETSHIVELLPLIAWRTIPQSERGVVGVIDYHGTIVPLVDLSLLATGKPSQRMMSTRIAVVRYGTDLVAVLLEHASKTIHKSETDFVSSRVNVPEAPYFGRITRDQQGLIQNVDLDELMPPAVRERLRRAESA